MGEERPLTIEQFYKFIREKRLMAVRCKGCGALFIPPRTICNRCFFKDLEWVEVKNRGKLITYTVIYVPPVQFQSMAPYAYGIIQLEDGPRIPGVIRNIEPGDIEIGMELIVDFEEEKDEEQEQQGLQRWPRWPRYFFRPP